jgi:hypothetical protein
MNGEDTLYNILMGRLKERDHLEDLGIDKKCF